MHTKFFYFGLFPLTKFVLYCQLIVPIVCFRLSFPIGIALYACGHFIMQNMNYLQPVSHL